MQHESDHQKEVTVEVFVPKDPDLHGRFTWPITLIIGEAATLAAAKLKYSGQNLTLAKGKVVFPPTETLEAARIDNGDKLDLISAGGGVCVS
jgi:hypothetical protein